MKPKRTLFGAMLTHGIRSLAVALLLFAFTSSGARAEALPIMTAAVSTGGHSGRWLTFGLDRISWLRGEVLGNPLWQYIASLLYIVLAFYAAKLLDSFIQKQLHR